MPVPPPAHKPERLKRLFSLLDLTTLNTDDGSLKVKRICEKLNMFASSFPHIPHVAAICVYPSLIRAVRETLTAEGVECVSVSAGFPSSQTFMQVKELESRMAIESGAGEIDIVLPLGHFLEGDETCAREEITRIKTLISPRPLKVILETGLLKTEQEIYRAAMLSMEAGADFIKTSTGKVQPAATTETVRIMCRAIRDFQKQHDRMIGIKPAGGITTTDQALAYAGIVADELGEEWLDRRYFRIGASRLANHLLTDIMTSLQGKSQLIRYF